LTKQQLETALNLLAEVFEDNQQYADLSQSAKELLARSLIRANELTKQ